MPSVNITIVIFSYRTYRIMDDMFTKEDVVDIVDTITSTATVDCLCI